MNRRFTDEQILGFLCEADTGVPVRQLCSKHGFSERSYYQWRARIVGGQPSLAQRLAALEDENLQLKRLLADSVLELAPQVRREPPLQWPDLLPLADPAIALAH